MRWHARAPPLRASSAWGTTEPQRHRCGHAEIGRATTNAAMTKCIVHSAASSLGNISALPPSFVGQPRHAPCALCQQTIMRGSDQSAVLAGPQRAYTTFRTRAVQPPSLRPCGNRCEQTQLRKKTCSVAHTRIRRFDSLPLTYTSLYTPPASSPDATLPGLRPCEIRERSD